MQFTPVLALYDPFGVDVPLNLDIPPPSLLLRPGCKFRSPIPHSLIGSNIGVVKESPVTWPRYSTILIVQVIKGTIVLIFCKWKHL